MKQTTNNGPKEQSVRRFLENAILAYHVTAEAVTVEFFSFSRPTSTNGIAIAISS
jgi:hypothetical protein